ncbi:protein SKIP34 [Telopea speciosissima]|uniref:protein SKIP34 n=1 Tax=Telopea speciosissima TaxID=54955 RepID=UPI001CC4CAC7|nr:protein SKIP34 [Telopea speciosissima]
MCFDQQRSLLLSELIASRARSADENAMVEALRGRLAETEARLERARAREAELTRRLEEMKRFISVMEILETYLKRRFRERQAQLGCRITLVPTKN